MNQQKNDLYSILNEKDPRARAAYKLLLGDRYPDNLNDIRKGVSLLYTHDKTVGLRELMLLGEDPNQLINLLKQSKLEYVIEKLNTHNLLSSNRSKNHASSIRFNPHLLKIKIMKNKLPKEYGPKYLMRHD